MQPSHFSYLQPFLNSDFTNLILPVSKSYNKFVEYNMKVKRNLRD